MSRTITQGADVRRYTLSELKELGYGSTDVLRRKMKRNRPELQPMNGAFRLRIDEVEAVLAEDRRRLVLVAQHPMNRLRVEARRVAASGRPLNAEDEELVAKLLRQGVSA